jgi:predicted membrane protein
MSSPLNPLTKNQQEFCIWAGVFGALIAAAALIQHMIFMIPGPLTYLMLIPYLFIIFSFSMLAAQKLIASILLVIASVFALVITALYIFGGAISPLVFIQLIYCIIVTSYLFLENIQEKLRRKKMMEQAEEDHWKGKI